MRQGVCKRKFVQFSILTSLVKVHFFIHLNFNISRSQDLIQNSKRWVAHSTMPNILRNIQNIMTVRRCNKFSSFLISIISHTRDKSHKRETLTRDFLMLASRGCLESRDLVQIILNCSFHKNLPRFLDLDDKQIITKFNNNRIIRS